MTEQDIGYVRDLTLGAVFQTHKNFYVKVADNEWYCSSSGNLFSDAEIFETVPYLGNRFLYEGVGK